jgi:hypothetical protein
MTGGRDLAKRARTAAVLAVIFSEIGVMIVLFSIETTGRLAHFRVRPWMPPSRLTRSCIEDHRCFLQRDAEHLAALEADI